MKRLIRDTIRLIVDTTEYGTLAVFVLVLLRLVRRSPVTEPRQTSSALPGASGVARSPRTIPVSAAKDGVPKIIFQTWKVRGPLPGNYQGWSESFSLLNPGYQHVIWDDADNREFIAAEFPWFLPEYDRYPKEIFRVDLVRLFFLFRYGGFYSDMDTECLRPLDRCLGMGDVILGRMGRDKRFPHSIPNAMMASKPGQLFWLLAISMAIERALACVSEDDFVARTPEGLTGPVLIRDAVLEYTTLSPAAIRERVAKNIRQTELIDKSQSGELLILPSRAWYPINWYNYWHYWLRLKVVEGRAHVSRAEVRRIFFASDLVTYWTHSW